MDNILSDAFEHYYKVLEFLGYKPYKDVKRILFFDAIRRLYWGEKALFKDFITEDDRRTIEVVLNNGFDCNCEFPRPKERVYTGKLQKAALPLYTITFVDYDGTELSVQHVKKYSSAIPPLVDREGYKFIGWSSDAYKNVKADATVTAIYQAKSFTINVLNQFTGIPITMFNVNYGVNAKTTLMDPWYIAHEDTDLKIPGYVAENTFIILDPETGGDLTNVTTDIIGYYKQNKETYTLYIRTKVGSDVEEYIEDITFEVGENKVATRLEFLDKEGKKDNEKPDTILHYDSYTVDSGNPDNPDSDIYVTLNYTAITHVCTWYDGDGVVAKKYTFLPNTDISSQSPKITIPSGKSEYTWDNASLLSNTPNEDFECRPIFTTNTLTVKFWDSVLKHTVIATYEVEYGKASPRPSDPTPEPGEVFRGWIWSSGSKDINKITEDSEFYAGFKNEDYTLEFKYPTAGFASWNTAKTSTPGYGSNILLEAPSTTTIVVPGFTWKGWYYDQAGTQAVGSSDTITKSTVVYLVPNVQTFTITYKYKTNGSFINITSETVAYGGEAKMSISLPSVAGYIPPTSYTLDPSDLNLKNVTKNGSVLYTYTAAPVDKFTVQFLTYDGKLFKSFTVESGQSVTAPGIPTRSGYSSVGWNTSADGTGSSWTEGKTYNITANVTLYACYKEALKTYTFSAYNEKTGKVEVIKSGEGRVGTAPTKPNDPTWSGHEFTGWKDKNGAAVHPIDGRAGYDDYVAQWKEIQTSVTIKFVYKELITDGVVKDGTLGTITKSIKYGSTSVTFPSLSEIPFNANNYIWDKTPGSTSSGFSEIVKDTEFLVYGEYKYMNAVDITSIGIMSLYAYENSHSHYGTMQMGHLSKVHNDSFGHVSVAADLVKYSTYTNKSPNTHDFPYGKFSLSNGALDIYLSSEGSATNAIHTGLQAIIEGVKIVPYRAVAVNGSIETKKMDSEATIVTLRSPKINMRWDRLYNTKTQYRSEPGDYKLNTETGDYWEFAGGSKSTTTEVQIGKKYLKINWHFLQ